MTSAILDTGIYADTLRTYGYDIIPTERIEAFRSYEQHHADMQTLIVDDTAFVLSTCRTLQNTLHGRYRVIECGENISQDYPHNIALNALYINHTLIGHLPYIDRKITIFCQINGDQFIDVQQGYTRCACAIAGDNALITADRGIYRTLIGERGLDILLISEGSITLTGADYGFIGGASGYDRHRLYFCGNIAAHPDYDRITEFCKKHGTEIISLGCNTLTDIGGILFC